LTILSDFMETLLARRKRQASRGGPLDIRTLPAEIEGLLAAESDASGLVTADRILTAFETMPDDEKAAFFDLLQKDLGLDIDLVAERLQAIAENETVDTYRAFAAAAEPKRQEFLRRLNEVPGATARLVRMRADLLRLTARGDDRMAIDVDFRHLLRSWFNRGFLNLVKIGWDSPARILEKIIAYEAVHSIGSWDDLRLRVDPQDRRCFAFFHPAMPAEPLIFVEVALTSGIPGSVQELLAPDRPALPAGEADTAVFYSISNCQAGLAGISFGNFLIKQVANDLGVELPNLSCFVTLSPIPGFAKWMEREGIDADGLTDETLRQLAARYLIREKRGDGLPVDPVARFHLGNGALIHEIHAGADMSDKGKAESHGVMVNYFYDRDRISDLHERFARTREVVATPSVEALRRHDAPRRLGT